MKMRITTRASALVFALVAQLVAHLHGKEGVVGSSPTVSIFIIYIERRDFRVTTTETKEQPLFILLRV